MNDYINETLDDVQLKEIPSSNMNTGILSIKDAGVHSSYRNSILYISCKGLVRSNKFKKICSSHQDSLEM